jgi:hypothetical protein
MRPQGPRSPQLHMLPKKLPKTLSPWAQVEPKGPLTQQKLRLLGLLRRLFLPRRLQAWMPPTHLKVPGQPTPLSQLPRAPSPMDWVLLVEFLPAMTLLSLHPKTPPLTNPVHSRNLIHGLGLHQSQVPYLKIYHCCGERWGGTRRHRSTQEQLGLCLSINQCKYLFPVLHYPSSSRNLSSILNLRINS